MSRGTRQKMRLLVLRDFLMSQSDEDHPLSTSRMISHLQSHQIDANRKTIYDDLETLRDYGLDLVRSRSGRSTSYFVGNRLFQLPELKLLVDSVQVSRFITHRKALELIQKLESLCSVHQAKLLNRQVFLTDRVKTHNESIYINVDLIYQAIADNRKIRFHYFDYGIDGKPVLRREGAFYEISPYAMTWSDQNYYLVAYDHEASLIKHYRVDKMKDMKVTDLPREGEDVFRAQDMPSYTRRLFSMFSGRDTTVVLRFHNSLAGVMMDRVGSEAQLVPDGPDHFQVILHVEVSPPFFGWRSSFRDQVEILGPEPVRREMVDYLRAILAVYQPAETV